jgi:hypothetical protein
MKSNFMFLVFLFSFNLFAAGGVDVGNGHIAITDIETISFGSEDELVEYSEILMGTINAGIDPEALALATLGQCDLNNFRFKEMNMNSFYPPIDKQRFSMKRIRAKILIEFYNCLNPRGLKKSLEVTALDNGATRS